MTFNFRGPLNLDNIAVYQPDGANATAWTQVSSWAAGQAPTNLVFMNNFGGTKSGEFSSKASVCPRSRVRDLTDGAFLSWLR